jgi:hypothetical protein
MTTVRDMVKKLQIEILQTADMPPHRASEVLVELTALYANVIEELRESELAYNGVLLTHLDAEEAASRAKIRAQTTEAYRRMRVAKDTEKVVVELIRSLKTVLKTKQEEMRLSR